MSRVASTCTDPSVSITTRALPGAKAPKRKLVTSPLPLRPVAGSLMGDWPAPPPADVERIARRITPYLEARGIGAGTAKAGCSRCNACSPMAAVERRDHSAVQRVELGAKPVAAARA